MQLHIDFEKITGCFTQAAQEGREFLFEYETYEVLRNSGAETPPRVQLLVKGTRPADEEIMSMPGDRVVMKIVSPTIIHKTDVGGVRIIDKRPDSIRSAWRRMMAECPESYASWIERHPGEAPASYSNLEGRALVNAIVRDVRGVLLCQYMPPDKEGLGSELIVGIRRTREFGMVISAGLGGTDTELYANSMIKGLALIAASTELTDGDAFFEMFKKTIAYKKLAGITRGQKRVVTDDQLIECFASFIAMANYYSPNNPDAPFVIDELEINPFAFTDYLMVPLDGMCRFSSKPRPLSAPRPAAKIDKLLHPSSIGIAGVSSTRVNFGRIILQNVLAQGFDPAKVTIFHPSAKQIENVACVTDLNTLGHKLDLLVLAVSAAQVPDMVKQTIDMDAAETVMLIPGGLGEKQGSEGLATELEARIDTAHRQGDGGPVFLGGNSVGVVSCPGRFDTVFIPQEKLPKRRGSRPSRAAFISQSGAFMITRMSKMPELNPAYLISIGNQTDLTAGDLMSYLKDLPDIDVIAVYMEGFRDMDGLAFCRAVRQAVLNGKTVLFYKAGRTPEGKTATSGHTASLAGDYMVCESCVKAAGALIADSFAEFENLYMLALRLHGKIISGNRLAAVSGAGFEAVGMADSIQLEDFAIKMAVLSEETEDRLIQILRDNRLDGLVDIRNPMDINPGANDVVHSRVVQTLLSDPNVDAVVVGLDPLSPSTITLPDSLRTGQFQWNDSSIVKLMSDLVAANDKPIIGVVDGGRLFDPLVSALEAAEAPVFQSCDRAVAALAKYIECRLRCDQIRS